MRWKGDCQTAVPLAYSKLLDSYCISTKCANRGSAKEIFVLSVFPDPRTLVIIKSDLSEKYERYIVMAFSQRTV